MKNQQSKKLSPFDTLEATIRKDYVPGQIVRLVNDIVAIEVNAAWRASPEGLKDAKEVDGYSAEQLKEVLKKQEANKAILQRKVDFFKRLYNEQEK